MLKIYLLIIIQFIKILLIINMLMRMNSLNVLDIN